MIDLSNIREVAARLGQYCDQQMVSQSMADVRDIFYPAPPHTAPEYVLYHIARDVADEANPISLDSPYQMANDGKVRTLIERTMNAEREHGTVQLTNMLFPALTLIGNHRSQLHSSVMIAHMTKQQSAAYRVAMGVNTLMAWLGMNRLLGTTMQTMVDELSPYQDGGFPNLDTLLWALRDHLVNALIPLLDASRSDAPWAWHRPMLCAALRPVLTDRAAIRDRVAHDVPEVYHHAAL